MSPPFFILGAPRNLAPRPTFVVTVDADGTVSAQPPLTAVASEHAILIVRQSEGHPDRLES